MGPCYPNFSHEENDFQNLRKLNFAEKDILNRSQIIQSWATSTAAVTEVSYYYPAHFQICSSVSARKGVIR